MTELIAQSPHCHFGPYTPRSPELFLYSEATWSIAPHSDNMPTFVSSAINTEWDDNSGSCMAQQVIVGTTVL